MLLIYLFLLIFSFLSEQSYDADLMEPHTIIQLTPATPSSTDSSKTSATASNMLENLLDELQTFSKQSSMDSPSSSTAISAHQRTSLRTALNSNAKQAILMQNQSDTVVRKGDHTCDSNDSSSSCSSPTSPPPKDPTSTDSEDGNDCKRAADSAAPECISNEQHIRESTELQHSELLQSAL